MSARSNCIANNTRSRKSCGTGLASRLVGRVVLRIIQAFVLMASALPRHPKTAVLAVSLVLGALLTTAALRLPGQQWLAWISFLPLFVVVRSLRPRAAALAGGFWGGFLYLFCSMGAVSAVDTVGPAIAPSPWLLALLIVIPAVYVCLASLPARAIGFKLVTLALGWTLIEVVLVANHSNTPMLQASARAVLQTQLDSGTLGNPYGFHHDLLTGAQGEGWHFHWLARLLGYVCTAFLVASANASLLGIASRAHLCFPDNRSWAGSLNIVVRLASQVVRSIQSWTLRQASPRAPPA